MTVESLRAQSTRLAAIILPEDQDVTTTQSIHRAIDESFVAGFRIVTLIGAVLATGSAMTALVLITAPKRG